MTVFSACLTNLVLYTQQHRVLFTYFLLNQKKIKENYNNNSPAKGWSKRNFKWEETKVKKYKWELFLSDISSNFLFRSLTYSFILEIIYCTSPSCNNMLDTVRDT